MKFNNEEAKLEVLKDLLYDTSKQYLKKYSIKGMFPFVEFQYQDEIVIGTEHSASLICMIDMICLVELEFTLLQNDYEDILNRHLKKCSAVAPCNNLAFDNYGVEYDYITL